MYLSFLIFSQISQQLTSKMFSSGNNLLKEKSEYPKSSKECKDINKIYSTVDSSKELNQNDDNSIINIVHPNHNIPKTVYYKRLCRKLVSQNETVKSHNIMPKQIEDSYTNNSNKITLDKNEDLKNDSDISKEIATPQMHNDPIENLSSTSVPCKSDVISNDCKFNNTPISPIGQCEKPEIGKENTSSPLFFSRLKNPLKLKRKMVISPATIGVQNSSNKTLKSLEKLNRNKIIDPDTHCIINNSPENKTIETLIKDTQPTLIDEHKYTVIDSKTDDKLHPTTNQELSQHLSTTVKNDQILAMEIETVPVSLKTEKMVNSLAVTKLKESSSIVCKQLSIDNEYGNSIKCVKLPRGNKKKSSGKLPASITCEQLSPDNEYDKSIKSEKSSTKNENKSIGKVSSPIPSKQHSTDCEFDKSIKYVKSPSYNKKKSSSSSQQSSNSEPKLSVTEDVCNSIILTEPNSSIKSCATNKSSETSIFNKTSVNIEVEQIPFKTRTVKILKDSNTLKLIKTRECSRVNCKNPLVDSEFNMSNKLIKNSTMSYENELILLEPGKNQLEHNSSNLNHKSDLLEFSQLNSPLKNKSDETSLGKNTSINIEVEQGSIFRRSNSRKVITHSSVDHDKTETKKGRRVQLITIQDHYSQPLPSFNGAKKKEIDVSKNSIHIEKVVESSSLFYIPQVKRRRTINFGNAES